MQRTRDFENFWTSINRSLFVPPTTLRKTSGHPGIMYRGLPNKDYELTTALQRLMVTVRRLKGGVPITSEVARKRELQYRERRLIDSFRKYARDLLPVKTSDWDVMVLGQHHRLPTRLLDWTASPLVALFFATEPFTFGGRLEHEPNGKIWCASHALTRQLCDKALLKKLNSQRKGSADIEFMRDFKTIEAFDAAGYSVPSLLWFEPDSVDQRIVNQWSVFSLMQGVTTRVDHWLNHHKDVAWCVDVPGRWKADLRKRLAQLNITDRTLFPGLEGIARWQRANYSD